MAMPAALRKYWAKHRRRKTTRAKANRPRRRSSSRRRTKRNYLTAGAVMNRPRRRSRRRALRNPRVRHYRRNPQFFGQSMPTLKDVLGVGAGIVAPPVVTSFLSPFIPQGVKDSSIGQILVKAGAVLIPSILVRKFVDREFGNKMLIGGAAFLLVDSVKPFLAGVLPGLSGMGYQPLLGAYGRRRGAGMNGYQVSPTTGIPFPGIPANSGLPDIFSGMPERLMPGRY